MAGPSSRGLLAKRIGWLVQYYQHEKPKHRASLQVEDGIRTVAFHPGKLLDQLKKCFLPDSLGACQQTLSPELRGKCLSLWWFQGWLNELSAKRQTGNEDGPPDLEEQVTLLVHNYPTAAPRKGEAVTVERACGSAYELNGHSLLEKIAPNFHEEVDEKNRAYVSQRLQQQVIVLPWSDEWLATGRKRREVARMRKLVTKEMKVEFLLLFFKHKKPAWKSRIPVIVPDGSGEIFDFYPGTWLDDLGDNWLKEARPNVVLTKGQMGAMETLPWFNEWLNTVREQRALREKNRVGNKRARRPSLEDESDSDDTYHTDSSSTQQENKTPVRLNKAMKSMPVVVIDSVLPAVAAA